MRFDSVILNLSVIPVPLAWQVTPASLLCIQSNVVASKLHFNSSLSTAGLQ